MEWLINSVLLSPLSLIALSCLVIPILIHIFNPSKGKLILIGNIGLISKAKNLRVTEVKIRQWILLILRLLIFSLISLLLAELFYEKNRSMVDKNHLFLSQTWLEQTTIEQKQEFLDANKSSSIFLLQPGFPRVSSSKQLQGHFTELSLDSFLLELHANSLFSTNNQFYLSTQQEQFSAFQNPLVSEIVESNSIDWRFKELSKAQISATSVAVYFDVNRTEELNNLKISFEAISRVSDSFSFTFHPISSELDEDILAKLSSNKDGWVIWLSDFDIPDELLASISNGQFLLASRIISKGEPQLTNIKVDGFDVHFYHSLPNERTSQFTPAWVNHHGQVALGYRNIGKGRIYSFNSHFERSANDLPNGIQLPIILANLLSNTKEYLSQRQIDTSQFEVKKGFSKEENDTSKVELVSYRVVLLLLLAFVWLIERVLSERRGFGYD